MAKGFKEAAARSKPVYGSLMGSAQPTVNADLKL